MNDRPPPTWALVLGFALLYISWGTTYRPINIAVREEHVPPLLFGGIRVIIAGILLLAYQYLRGSTVFLSAREFPAIVGVSVLLFLGGNGLMNMAGQTVDSAALAILAATTPLWLGLFAMAIPRDDRLTPRGWFGLFVGLCGVFLLLAPRLRDPARLFDDFGPFYALGSAASWAIGSLILRHLRIKTPHLTVASYQMLIGGIYLVVLAWFLGEPERLPASLTPRAIGAFLYCLFVGSLVGFVCFNWLLGHVSAAKVGTYAYVNPVVAILVGWSAGEILSPAMLAGIVVILFGVFLVRGGERPTQLTESSETASDPVPDWKPAQVSEPS